MYSVLMFLPEDIKVSTISNESTFERYPLITVIVYYVSIHTILAHVVK